jgi:hypothetical protein
MVDRLPLRREVLRQLGERPRRQLDRRGNVHRDPRHAAYGIAAERFQPHDQFERRFGAPWPGPLVRGIHTRQRMQSGDA